MKISVDQSPVGVGKTYKAIERALDYAGLWLFAVERIDSIKELAERLNKMANTKNVSAKIVSISSEPDEKETIRGTSVRTEVESLCEKYQNGHVIAICSHSAMMMTDFSKFTEWHFVCDEVPSLLDINKKQTKLDVAFFEKYFELDPVAKGEKPWSVFKPTAAGMKLTGSDLIQDESHKHLAKLHLVTKLANQGKIAKIPVTTLADFKDMEGDNVYWVWWSLLSITHLDSFKSITFLASQFSESMTRKIIDSWHDNIEWCTVSHSSTRTFQNRRIFIRYYSCRKATINFLSSKIGQQHLQDISADIKRKTQSQHLIWSANASFKTTLESNLGKAAYRRPKQAGTDLLMDRTHAAMIYSAQPANYVLDILELFELGQEDWVRSNEYETILQFVSRTAVRDANSSQDIYIFVYNEAQARYLESFFSSQSHNQVSLEYSDIGLVYPSENRGRPKQLLTPRERRRKDSERRKRRNAAQKIRRANNKASE